MEDVEPVEVGLRVTAALDYCRSSHDEDIRPHYLRMVQQLTEAVNLTDLTASELVSLTALLIPAHSRVITGRARPDATPPVGKILTLVRDDSAI